MCFLVVCDAIVQYQSRPLDYAPALAAGAAPAAPADKVDDADEGEGAGGAGGDGAGGAGGAGEKRPDPHHFMAWDLDEILYVPWKMSFTKLSNSSECYSFWSACIAFFYTPNLPKKVPDVDANLTVPFSSSGCKPIHLP